MDGLAGRQDDGAAVPAASRQSARQDTCQQAANIINICLQDSDLQPGVLNACREHGVWMAWLDAKMPVPQFLRHQGSQRSRAAVSKLLNMFDLVLPETDTVRSL